MRHSPKRRAVLIRRSVIGLLVLALAAGGGVILIADGRINDTARIEVHRQAVREWKKQRAGS